MSGEFALPPAPVGWQFDPEPYTPDGEAPTEAWLDGYIHHFSASGLRLLKICPEAWRQRYILGKKERPGEALTVGKAVHSSIGYSHQQKIDSHEDLPVTTVLEYYNDLAWPAAVEQDGGVDEIRWDKKPDEVRGDGHRMTTAYHVTVSPRVQPLAVEHKFTIEVPGVPVPFLGYIDVVEELNNVDLKTGKQVQRKIDANGRLQGTLYTHANGRPTHFHSVSRARTPSIATPLESPEMVVGPHPLQHALVEDWLLSWAKQVEFYFNEYGPDHHWPYHGAVQDYKGGPACNFCGFRPTCGWWEWERVAAPAPIVVPAMHVKPLPDHIPTSE